MLPSRRLRDDELALHVVQRHLAIEVRHRPVHPSPAHLVVELVDDPVPCTAADAVARLEKES